MPPTSTIQFGPGGGSGFWGPVTSSIDWCEANYEVTPYIAEFWNTLSNLAMIVPPLVYWLRLDPRSPLRKDRRYSLALVFLGIVGVGSWLFHMTLLYEMQLFDELPMIWGSLVFLYSLITILWPHLRESPFLKGMHFAYGFLVSVIYLAFPNPLFHQFAYGVLVTSMLFLNVAISRKSYAKPALFYASAFFFYAGFAVWNLDNIFCNRLTHLRTSGTVPAVLAPATQLHAVWHILAGYGSFLHIIFGAHAQANKDGYPTDVEYYWTGIHLKAQLTPGPSASIAQNGIHKNGAQAHLIGSQRKPINNNNLKTE